MRVSFNIILFLRPSVNAYSLLYADIPKCGALHCNSIGARSTTVKSRAIALEKALAFKDLSIVGQWERHVGSWALEASAMTIPDPRPYFKELHDPRREGGRKLHIVSAWACQGHVVLAQEIVDEKSNEITAVPPLLSLLEIEGATVTADAMGCQRAIAEVIHASEAGYVLAVKDNQPKLCEDVQSFT